VIHLQPDVIATATSEAELAPRWWWLITRGVRKVELVGADWDGARRAWSPQCQPFRLCG
jgi:hypothetical protein